MTTNRRIVLNVMATYGRSLIALVCGLFASRWVLMALGQSDFGLYGVVGGLTAFIAFFNSLLAGAISRFFAFSVGEAMLARDPETGLAECRKWFNTAVFVHTAIPVVVMLVGYPIGVYAVRNWLTIQPDRVEAAVWVFRFVCISCFVGMVNVPFSAMFTAKQYIAELTLYSLITTILNVTGLYYMVCHPGFWLVKYSLWICLISVVPQILICWRATVLFQECRIKVGWLFDASRLRQLGAYAGWQMFGAFGSIARSQGIAILVNKFFGTRLNATMSVANQVAAQSVTLSSALNGAFAPALTTYAGAGDNAKMLRMAYQSSKFGTMLCLLFLLPLSLELESIINLWLKNPPPMIVPATYCVLIMTLISQLIRGLDIAINSTGRVAQYNFVVGLFNVLSLPIAWVVLKIFAGGFLSVFYVLVAFKIAVVFIVLPIARKQVGISIRYWTFEIAFRALLVAALVLLLAAPLHFTLNCTAWIRVPVVALFAEIIFIPLAWFVLLDKVERRAIGQRISARFMK